VREAAVEVPFPERAALDVAAELDVPELEDAGGDWVREPPPEDGELEEELRELAGLCCAE
jgi:hypothetical protein